MRQRSLNSTAHAEYPWRARPRDRDLITMFEGGYSPAAMVERWGFEHSVLCKLYKSAKSRQAAALRTPLEGHGLQVANTTRRWLSDADIAGRARDAFSISCAGRTPLQAAA
jgi:hypothetical protein